MPFTPTITLDLAAPNRSCRFTIGAASLGVPPLTGTNYAKLVEGLASVIRQPTDFADAAALVGFALLVLFSHPPRE